MIKYEKNKDISIEVLVGILDRKLNMKDFMLLILFYLKI